MAPQSIALMTRAPTDLEGPSDNAMGLKRLGGFFVDLCALRVSNSNPQVGTERRPSGLRTALPANLFSSPPLSLLGTAVNYFARRSSSNQNDTEV